MKRSIGSCITVLCLAASTLAAADSASAATVRRAFHQNGGSACTGALPTYEGALRKRPKAIANEGTSSAFITCSAIARGGNVPKPVVAYAYFTNRGGSTASVSCTLVNGDEFYGSNATPRTLSLPPGQFLPMNFSPSGAEFFHYAVNLSCSLPPGVELNLFGYNIDEEVGA